MMRSHRLSAVVPPTASDRIWSSMDFAFGVRSSYHHFVESAEPTDGYSRLSESPLQAAMERFCFVASAGNTCAAPARKFAKPVSAELCFIFKHSSLLEQASAGPAISISTAADIPLPDTGLLLLTCVGQAGMMSQDLPICRKFASCVTAS